MRIDEFYILFAVCLLLTFLLVAIGQLIAAFVTGADFPDFRN